MLAGLFMAYGVLLISLALGVIVLVWGLQNRGSGSVIAKIFGVIIVVLSILFVSFLFYSAREWSKQPVMMPMHGKPMLHGKPEHEGKAKEVKSTENADN